MPFVFPRIILPENNEETDATCSNAYPDFATPPRGGRGPYKRHSESAKKRVVAAANEGADWRRIAKANGIKIPTADTWIREQHLTPRRPRGGIR